MSLPSRCLAAVGDIRTDWLEGFMKYGAEMDSDAIIYIQRFLKIGLTIQKLMGGCVDTQTA